MFNDNEKSTFKYWLAHLFAYNMVALNLKVWKFKYLFHDFEKPWLKLILRDYFKVRNIHRKYNKHHLAYRKKSKIDWEAVVIDWECSRFTKASNKRNAREMYEHNIGSRYERGIVDENMRKLLIKNVPPILNKLGL